MFLILALVFVLVWLAGFIFHAGGIFIHALLLFAVLSALAQLFAGNRAAGARRNSGTQVLVLRKFSIGTLQTPVRLEIVGRQVGLQAFLLTLLHIDPESKLILTADTISVTKTSLAGTVHTSIPLKQVQGTECGCVRSIAALVLAVIFLTLAALTLVAMLISRDASSIGLPVFVFQLVVFGVAVATYIMSKTIVIRVSSGLMQPGYAFKRSLLENTAIDLPQALLAVDMLNYSILHCSSAATVAASGNRCMHCQAVNPAGTIFCENCGKQL